MHESTEEKLMTLIRSGYSGLYVNTPEEGRVAAMLRRIVERLNQVEGNDYDLYTFDIHEGLINILEPGGNGERDPVAVVMQAANLNGQGIVLLKDFHIFLESGGGEFAITVKRAVQIARSKGNHLIFCGCRKVIPPEIEREVTLVEFQLPERGELDVVVTDICESAGVTISDDLRPKVVGALQGLTTVEAADALSYSLVKNGRFDPKDIALEKANQVKKSGLLEIVSSGVGLDDIGGLEIVKGWALERVDVFNPEALLWGCDIPKGALALGLPGTGKSLFSVALGNIFGLPILKCNIGKLFGSLVGESEANVRQVTETADAMQPCILWLDEIDKGLGSAAKSSTSGDSGTSDRVLSTLLDWMQEKTTAVFVVATANDPARLEASDGALIRKGRFDEVFFFDLPHAGERESIIRIHLGKRARSEKRPLSPIHSLDDFDMATLVDISEGYTGAEIAAAISSSVTSAFSARRERLTDVDLALAFGNVVPLSTSMGEAINRTRKWAEGGRCRWASTRVNNSNGNSGGNKRKINL